MTSVEHGIAEVNHRIDNIAVRMDRAERRLDLTEDNSFAEMAEKFEDS